MTGTETLLNSADDNLHFSSQMLANRTICTEPYDLPEGKRKDNTKPCDSGKKKKPSAWVEKSLSNVLCVCLMQINLKQPSKMTFC